MICNVVSGNIAVMCIFIYFKDTTIKSWQKATENDNSCLVVLDGVTMRCNPGIFILHYREYNFILKTLFYLKWIFLGETNSGSCVFSDSLAEKFYTLTTIRIDDVSGEV